MATPLVSEMCGRGFFGPRSGHRLPIGHPCHPYCLVCAFKAAALTKLQVHGCCELNYHGDENCAWRALAELVVAGLAYDVVEPDGRVLLVLSAEGAQR